MNFILVIKSIILGIIEGITEWLPVSSTGHLILANSFMKISEKDFFNSQIFLYVIQLGAILAIVTVYFHKLNPFAPSKTPEEKKGTWQMWFKVAVGCIPAAVVGLALNDLMDRIATWQTVSATLIIYGIAFIVIESLPRKEIKVPDISDMTYKTALLIGLFQVLSIVPGTSRSGATILGAVIFGCSRSVAAEFSFFLSIPVMFGISFIKIITNEYVMTSVEWIYIAIAFAAAYLVSVMSVKILTGFVKKHDFKPFGYYRIILGIFVIIYFAVTGAEVIG